MDEPEPTPDPVWDRESTIKPIGLWLPGGVHIDLTEPDEPGLLARDTVKIQMTDGTVFLLPGETIPAERTSKDGGDS